MFLIDKKITPDKPLTGSITKYDKALLQFTRASLITNYDNLLLQFTIACLLQFSTTVITIYDRYYKLRQVLQFTTLLQITTEHAFHINFGLPSRVNSFKAQSMRCRFFRQSNIERLNDVSGQIFQPVENSSCAK